MGTTVAGLPRIVQFIDKTDSGEFGNDTCAHCGALGRYQFIFLGDDGKRHRAMSGCIKLYPVAAIAKVHAKLIDKGDKLRRQYGAQAHLNKWDTTKLEAVQAFYDGNMTEGDALRIIQQQDASAKAWRAKKGMKF